jgi:hypothetical protein
MQLGRSTESLVSARTVDYSHTRLCAVTRRALLKHRKTFCVSVRDVGTSG